MTLLSKSDVAILRRLQRDWSEPRQEMADALGMSLSTLRRRIRELEAAGLITGAAALVDARRAGVSVCVFVSVDLVSHEPSVRKAFEEWVNQAPEVLECYSVTGQHDYTLIIRTMDVSDFERLLMDRILGHASVASAMSNIALREHKYTVELPLRPTRE